MKLTWTTLVLLPLVAAACARSTPAPESTATRAPVAVRLAPVARTELADRLEVGGVVRARTTADVSARLMATVTERRVTAGDRVARGQVLVVLDDRDLAAQSRQAEATVGAAEQGLAAARAEAAAASADQVLAAASHARIAGLRSRNAATAQELDDAQARLAGAQARVDGATAHVAQATAALAATRAASEAAQTTRSFSLLTAPFDGVVTETLVETGAMAAPGVPLVRIDAAGAQEVAVRVDESRAAWIHPGDAAEVVIDNGQGADPVAGIVTEVARAIEAGDRAFAVKVSLTAARGSRSGAFARVRFRGAVHEALTVPTQSVRRQGQVTTVFVVDAGVARMRLIQTGRVDGDRTEVLAGLDLDEQVVSPVPPALVDGSPVTAGATAGGARR